MSSGSDTQTSSAVPNQLAREFTIAGSLPRLAAAYLVYAVEVAILSLAFWTVNALSSSSNTDLPGLQSYLRFALVLGTLSSIVLSVIVYVDTTIIAGAIALRRARALDKARWATFRRGGLAAYLGWTIATFGFALLSERHESTAQVSAANAVLFAVAWAGAVICSGIGGFFWMLVRDKRDRECATSQDASSVAVSPQMQRSPLGYFASAFARYGDFEGRARRKEFWWFYLLRSVGLVIVFFGILYGVAGILQVFHVRESTPWEYTNYALATAWVAAELYVFVTLLPWFAVQVRRLHDTGRSGWWWWLWFIPVLGELLLLIFYCGDSSQGQNKYGANPKGVVA